MNKTILCYGIIVPRIPTTIDDVLCKTDLYKQYGNDLFVVSLPYIIDNITLLSTKDALLSTKDAFFSSDDIYLDFSSYDEIVSAFKLSCKQRTTIETLHIPKFTWHLITAFNGAIGKYGNIFYQSYTKKECAISNLSELLLFSGPMKFIESAHADTLNTVMKYMLSIYQCADKNKSIYNIFDPIDPELIKYFCNKYNIDESKYIQKL
jgi:hypothetical protein